MAFDLTSGVWRALFGCPHRRSVAAARSSADGACVVGRAAIPMPSLFSYAAVAAAAAAAFFCPPLPPPPAPAAAAAAAGGSAHASIGGEADGSSPAANRASPAAFSRALISIICFLRAAARSSSDCAASLASASLDKV